MGSLNFFPLFLKKQMFSREKNSESKANQIALISEK